MKKSISFGFFLISIFFLVRCGQAQCFISSFGNLGQLSKTSGNSVVDTKLNGSKTDIESLFGVSADLFIYNDNSSPNAFATQSNNPLFDGMVAFGENMLLQKLWNMTEGEAAVAGILAHEYGHVLQMKKGCNLSQYHKELDADFLAGYYFGSRGYTAVWLPNFAKALFELGDFAFWNPSHHGTPTERVNAMIEGFNHSNESIDDAYESGIAYVSGENTIGNVSGNGTQPTTLTVTCTRCGGTGVVETQLRSPTCYGRGYYVCPTCGGTKGYYAYGLNIYGVYGYWPYPCQTCGGNGTIVCTTCAGTGIVNNSVTCPVCGGTGLITR